MDNHNHRGLLDEHLEIESKDNKLHESKEILEGSWDASGALLIIPENKTPQKPESKNFALGAMFMFITITLISISHFIVKLLSISSPYITVFDVQMIYY